MKLQQDMRKKKQEMLEKQIECQKVGLECLLVNTFCFVDTCLFSVVFPGILYSCSFINT